MTKFGQAEYNDFMARIFADKLDKLLKEIEKQDFNNRNTEDIYKEFASSKDAAQGGIEMLGFIIGIFIGGIIGVFAMALCIVAGQADKHENCTGSDK